MEDAESHVAFERLQPFIAQARSSFTFFVNGEKVTLHDADPEWTLLDFVRSRPGLKGTKLGCGEGGCGACTVALQTFEHGQVKHLAVNACLFPLIGAAGKHVITVEGLGDVDNPHPLQERIAKLHGSQCGFCTPGIVMSLYCMIRNSYNPTTKCFHLSEHDIELEGHLDGNLCRCTGYKPILKAAKTFITEDLAGQLVTDLSLEDSSSEEQDTIPYRSESAVGIPLKTTFSCGRPGGCCRDEKIPAALPMASSLASTSSQETVFSQQSSRSSSPSSVESLESDKTSPIASKNRGMPQYSFKPYAPGTELLFPRALRSVTAAPICFGNSGRIWLRPVTLEQLVMIKNIYPEAKLVGGSSEVQIEVRFKRLNYDVSVYVGDIQELKRMEIPSDDELHSLQALVIGANTSLTDVENTCKTLVAKLGRRAQVLEAARKQLRFFAGRQIRNVASLAGNIATASPISDMNPVLLAAGATIGASSATKGSFTLPMSSFFVAYRKTALPSDAIITKIRIPLASSDREVFKAYKQAKRKDDDIAIVTTAFRVKLDSTGLVQDVSLAFGGMAPRTVEAVQTMKVLAGRKWYDTRTLDSATTALLKEFDLSFEVPGGMASYRKTLAISLFFRFWHEAVADLGLGPVDPSLVKEIHRNISKGARDDYNPYEQRIVGKQIPHLSALKQTTGEAEYVDDIPAQERELFGGLVLSSKAHARLVSVDWTAALEEGFALGYVDINDISKEANLWGSIIKDEPFFADGEVFSEGQPIGMVFATSALKAQAAARRVKVVYEDLPVILTIDDAIAAKSFFKYGKMLKKGYAIDGDMADAWAKCDRVFEGVTKMGGQEHFYLETNAALVIPHREDGSMEVWSSTQNTMEVQEFVSRATGVPSNKINSRVKRMGGAFGGKESRACQIAGILAVAAKKTKRPMRCMLNRDEDMMTSGQRHPFQARWKVGTTNDGKLIALEADVYNNAGFSVDMSTAVMDRCLTHFENCYEIPHVCLRGHVCKTNTHSNTAFRGFGGPQGMYIAESYMSAVAEGLGIPIDELRLRNLYKQGQHTPFLQTLDEDWHVPMLLEQLKRECSYEQRQANIKKFNEQNKWKKRGICMIPTKFGLSFATALHLNQANASVKIFADGSVLLHHGGTEMGQGLYTKMVQIASQELGVPVDAVYTQDTTSYQTANASPTAASSGSDLNGMAVKNACDQLNERLQPIRARLGPAATMAEIAHTAYRERINLNAHGFWKMPKIGYQWGSYDIKTVKPMYYYFTQGACCTEVELDCLTGDHTVLRTDIKMDIGRSINPAIDYGQIEGAFVQGQGLFTMEETLWTQRGQLATRGPGTYKIPGFSDIPQEFNVSFLQDVPGGWKHLRSIQSSKGIGEPPLFLGATVLFALREALRSARAEHGVMEPLVLDSPATAERLRLLVQDDLVRKGTVEPREGEKNFFVKVE